MKKFSVLALSALLLMGCSTAPAQKTDAELEAEGWVKNPLENGYVMATDAPAPAALPDPRDTTKMKQKQLVLLIHMQLLVLQSTLIT